MSEVLKVAALQMCSGRDVAANLEAIAEGAKAAAVAGAQYLLTPEVSLAYARDRKDWAGLAEPFAQNRALKEAAQLAQEHQISLHIGSLAIALEDGSFANRSVLLGPDGGVIASYDKIHLFDADPPGDKPYRESDSYRGGDAAVVADVQGFKLGMSICYDVRFPALYAMLAENGAEILSVPAAFTVPTGRAHWDVLLRARAIETGSYVVAAAQGGTHENGRQTWGHSMIVDPWGAIVAEKGDDKPGLIVAEIDRERVRDARARLPTLANRRQFSLSVNHKLLK